ncbi:hypothetical protein RRF57_003264 [Xylaria bambusicola]|uniref:NADH-ubiquinone oxidoreductase B15 subunit n=1 Tax=Xylaria bambusicola TaxID=326684 RepID=A0AAN7UEH5_9PEZI
MIVYVLGGTSEAQSAVAQGRFSHIFQPHSTSIPRSALQVEAQLNHWLCQNRITNIPLFTDDRYSTVARQLDVPLSVKMGGLQHYRMAMDPAIQKLGTMTTNRHKYFRWTPRTAGTTFGFLVVVPFIIGVIGYQTDVRRSLRTTSHATGDPQLFKPNAVRAGPLFYITLRFTSYNEI